MKNITMTEKNISQEFRMRNIDEIRKYFIEEIKQNDLLSRKKAKKLCKILNHTENSLILASTTTEYVSISAFASLVGISIGITNSVAILKNCLIISEIKKYKLIIKKKKSKHDKIVLLAKTKLNSVEILIYKALIDENISYDEFVSIKNAQREYDDMKKK